jgi:hypothetical protein
MAERRVPIAKVCGITIQEVGYNLSTRYLAYLIKYNEI